MCAVAGAILLVSAAHYGTRAEHFLLHNVFQRLYYVPILMACAWFGLRGGLLAAIAAGGAYAPHIAVHWRHVRAYQTSQALELAMFVGIAFVAGALWDRERRARREAERTAAERDRALRDLETTVETLREADRLATLGTLAAGMAHEIRNPLGAVAGAVDILDQDYPPGHPRREFLEILRAEVDRLSLTAGRYLDLARPRVPEPRPVDVNVAVHAAAELLAKGAERAAVAIEEVYARPAPTALADPAQLHQALVNLLLNAIQSMTGGGRVIVATSSRAEEIRIDVRDFGPGLPDVSAERLFEPFFTLKPGGTGLGLAIARRIALAHGGKLEARQADGGGALFSLSLPSSPAQDPP